MVKWSQQYQLETDDQAFLKLKNDWWNPETPKKAPMLLGQDISRIIFPKKV